MPVLPFHNYLGPGNDVDSGDPVDEDDRIAQQHDIAYEMALTAEDVSNADEKAINAFLKNYNTTGNWHSLIGAFSLTAKLQLEKRIGVIYPDLLSPLNIYDALRLRKCQEEHKKHQPTTQPTSDIDHQEKKNPMKTNPIYDSPTNDVTKLDNVTPFPMLKLLGPSCFILCYFLIRSLKKRM